MSDQKKEVVISIAGLTDCGKSTVAAIIEEALKKALPKTEVSVISADGARAHKNAVRYASDPMYLSSLSEKLARVKIEDLNTRPSA